VSRNDRPPLKRALRACSILQELMKTKGIGEQITRHQAWLVWDKIVGEQIANRARPLRLRRGVLEVQVDHPVWMQQLHMLKPQILEKINAQVPNAGITDIYLRQAKSTDPVITLNRNRKQEDLPWQKVELDATDMKIIEEKLTRVSDAELKQEFKRLLIRQKQLEKSRSH